MMGSFWDHSFVVTDVETTGHSPEKHRITELACVLVEGGEIVREFSSLVNPHQFIPPYIAQMTGISNEMAYQAPEVKEILPQVKEFLERKNAIFVAHNVKFDWSFIQQTFWREHFQFPAIPKLCSLKLSRSVLPNDLKKNVGSLAEYFDVPLVNRHRALGDAKATAQILIELLEIIEHEHNVKTFDDLLNFHNKRSHSFSSKPDSYKRIKDKIDKLPTSPGIYNFYDQGGKLIYVGKSKNLRARVNSYFSKGAIRSRKINELISSIYDLDWEETTSELSALIRECRKIKDEKPYFNRQHKAERRYPFIKLTTDEIFPKAVVSYDYKDDNAEYFGPFRNSSLVEAVIKIIDDNFKLIKCDFSEAIKSNKLPCIYYQIGKCKAPCVDATTNGEYLIELDNVREFLNGFSSTIISSLEDKMKKFAENLNFESAAKLRDQISDLKVLFERCKNAPTSINNNNLVLILPNSAQEKTLDLYMIIQGKLFKEKTIGKFAPLNGITEIISDAYYNKYESKEIFDQAEVEEIRIVNSWIYKQKDKGEIIYSYNKSKDEFISSIENSIKNFKF